MIKKVFFLLFITLFMALQPVSAGEPEEKSGFFRWAVVKTGTGGNKKNVVPLTTKDINFLSPSEQPGLFFCPLKNSYLYLLLSGPGDSLTLLFPGSYNNFARGYETFEQDIETAVHLKQSGRYELHVLVSASRLKELEVLLDRYGKLKGTGTKEVKDKLGSDVLFLIKKLKRTFYFSTRKQTLFTGEAGSNRVEQNKIEQHTRRIDFEDFYFELYIIEKK